MRIVLIVLALLISACAPTYSPPDQAPYPDRPVADTGDYCGGMMGVVCGNPQDFCRMTPEPQCGAADQTGICSPVPQMCTMDYNPVCGCDGQTYSNECAANSRGISAAYSGECRS